MDGIRFAATAALWLSALAAHAQDAPPAATRPVVRVGGVLLGSGVPAGEAAPATAVADPVAGNEYHVPGYLPGYPTAAPLWPRVVYVPCKRDAARGDLVCAGYDVSPLRGEYVYLRPLVQAVPPPAEAPRPTPVPRPAPPVRKQPLG